MSPYKHTDYNRTNSCMSQLNIFSAPMMRAIGLRMSIDEVHEPIYENKHLQQIAFVQVRFEKPLPLLALMAFSDQRELPNLMEHGTQKGN